MSVSEQWLKESPVLPRLDSQNWEPAKELNPQIISVTKSLCDPGFAARIQSTSWTLDYSFTSCGLFKVRSIKQPWKERKAFEAHLYPPHVPYWEDTSTAQIDKTRCIFINFVYGEKVGLPALVGPHSYARFLDPSRRLGELLERGLNAGLALGESGFWDAQGIFCEIIGLLLRSRHLEGNAYEIPAADHSVDSDFVLAVHKYMKDNLAGRVTRELLARHLNISIATLARRYGRETGDSPMATLTAIRINTARTLLLRGYRLKFIAAQTGFSDAGHLSKTFKKIVGVAPREFLKQAVLTSQRSMT